MKSKIVPVFAIATLGACLGLSSLAVPAAHADPGTGTEAVAVTQGFDQGTYSISSTVSTATYGSAPTQKQFSMGPSDQSRLPVRLSLSYQAGDRSGTNLLDMKGYSGPLTIRLTVQNTTVQARELSFEQQGAKYRSYGLVGAPYTVIAMAALGADTSGRVVTSSSDGPVTDGAVSMGENSSASVLWTAILAPPVLLPTAVFTLVVDAKDFQPPQFDVIVEPGIVTDPSISGLLSGGSQSNSRAAELMLQVQQQVGQARDLVSQLQVMLSDDAAKIGARTYAELSSSATITLAQLDALKSSMQSMVSSVSSSLSSAQSTMTSTLTSVFTNISQNVLGDVGTPITLVYPADMTGCDIAIPTLDPAQQPTVAATLQLLAAQTSALADAFADQTGTGAVTENCRSLMLRHIRLDIGDPSLSCAIPVDPTIELDQSNSVYCMIGQVSTTLARLSDPTVPSSEASMRSSANTAAMAASTAATALLTWANQVDQDLRTITQSVSGAVAPLIGPASAPVTVPASVTDDLTARLGVISALAGSHVDVAAGLQPLVDDVYALAAADPSCPAIPDGTATEDALTMLNVPGCSVAAMAAHLLAAVQAAAQDGADWAAVAVQAATGGPVSGVVAQAGGDLTRTLLTPATSTTLSLSDIYTGTVAIATTPAEACSLTSTQPTITSSMPSVDALFMAVNVYVCSSTKLGTALTDYEAAVQAGLTDLATSIVNAQTTAGNAFTATQADIDALSGQINTSLNQQAAVTTAADEALLQQSTDQLTQAQTTVTTNLQSQIAALTTLLKNQVNASITEADATKASLQRNFKNLLIDLGNPADLAPTGLIGSLKTSAALTGTAADQLATLGGLVQNDIDTQGLAAQNAAMQYQQLSDGQQMLNDPLFFCGQPRPDGAITIYSFHIGEA